MKNVTLAFPIAILLVACSKAPTPSTSAPSASASSVAKPAAPLAITPFEGEILVTVTDDASKKLPSSIAYDVKGNKVAYVPAATALRAIGDLDAWRVYAINDAEKRYDALDLKAPAGAKSEPIPAIYKTGKMEKIAGLDCEDWLIGDGSARAEVCAATGIAYMDLAGDAKSGRAEIPWATALTNARAFPLRVLVHGKTGQEEYRAEATKVERKKLDDSVFQLPSGYKQGDLARETKTASLP